MDTTVSLGTFPTPLEPAPRLAAALSGGGNKVRKLERTVATALRDGADSLITTGAAQSNHARLTAAAGARAGLPGLFGHREAASLASQ